MPSQALRQQYQVQRNRKGFNHSVLNNTLKSLKSKTRFNRAIQLSDEGLTVQQASDQLGISIASLRGLIRTHTGSQAWPVNDN